MELAILLTTQTCLAINETIVQLAMMMKTKRTDIKNMKAQQARMMRTQKTSRNVNSKIQASGVQDLIEAEERAGTAAFTREMTVSDSA